MPNEPFKRALRASDADREATVERLRVAAIEGRLDADELDERLTSAYDARWCHQLESLTLDVTPPPAPARRSPPVFVRPAAPTTNGLAIASVVAGVFWLGWVGSVLAVIAGHIALGQIARSAGRQRGRGVAIAGLALGYFGLLTLSLVMFGFWIG